MVADNALSGLAIAVGVYQMVDSIMKRDRLTIESRDGLVLSSIASALWLTYKARKGSNFGAMYTGLGLAINLFLLYSLYRLEERRRRPDWTR